MPYLTVGIAKHTYTFRAWRWAFFFPACLQILWGLVILKFAQVLLITFLSLPAPPLHSIADLTGIS